MTQKPGEWENFKESGLKSAYFRMVHLEKNAWKVNRVLSANPAARFTGAPRPGKPEKVVRAGLIPGNM
jgi:hypothetical protein